jgi:hypothetical protein
MAPTSIDGWLGFPLYAGGMSFSWTMHPSRSMFELLLLLLLLLGDEDSVDAANDDGDDGADMRSVVRRESGHKVESERGCLRQHAPCSHMSSDSRILLLRRPALLLLSPGSLRCAVPILLGPSACHDECH